MKTVDARRSFQPEDMLDDEALGLYLGVTPQHIRCSRMQRPTWDGPTFIEISPKVKRYLFADVLEWAKARRVNPAHRVAKA